MYSLSPTVNNCVCTFTDFIITYIVTSLQCFFQLKYVNYAPALVLNLFLKGFVSAKD